MKPQFLDVVGGDGWRRRIAYLTTPGAKADQPGLVWLSGLMSDMVSTKASFLADWAAAHGVGMTRFDFSGHGQSEGEFTDGTIGRWLEEALAILRQVATGPQILVGSSMGGWIALLAMRHLAWGSDGAGPIRGAVLIAPAWDMTEELMWKTFPAEARAAIERDGVYHQPSAYGDQPYPLTRRLIEEGRAHLIGETPFDPGCPVRILQGLRDPDVPWEHSVKLQNLLQSDDVLLELIDEGDHRLSRPQDLDRLALAVAEPLNKVHVEVD